MKGGNTADMIGFNGFIAAVEALKKSDLERNLMLRHI